MVAHSSIRRTLALPRSTNKRTGGATRACDEDRECCSSCPRSTQAKMVLWPHAASVSSPRKTTHQTRAHILNPMEDLMKAFLELLPRACTYPEYRIVSRPAHRVPHGHICCVTSAHAGVVSTPDLVSTEPRRRLAQTGGRFPSGSEGRWTRSASRRDHPPVPSRAEPSRTYCFHYIADSSCYDLKPSSPAIR